MDLENERVLKLIFPDGVPENLRENPELYSYLANLGTYKVEQLKKEQTRLADETKRIVEQTQDLAISNYKTFICTAENSRSIFTEFQNAEEQVGTLLSKLPLFTAECESFLAKAEDINENRRINSITLKKNAQLLEILELPQLMERCIREGRYEEALELASFVQKLGHNHSDIPIIKSIVHSVEALWHTMLVQLVAQLRSDLQLPKCLQIVGYLRRMQAFGNNELKLKFLQARDTWLIGTLKSISKDDAQQHLTKTIEVTRINLFNIITQYRAIFPDEEPSSVTVVKPLQGVSCDGERLFQSWLHRKIDDFLQTLESDLERGVSSYDTVLGQCMYFGLSFSRVGADFRALMVPIFLRVIRKNFENAISKVNQSFAQELERYTLINKPTLHTRAHKVDTTSVTIAQGSATAQEQELFAPPETLLDFHPLAALCNGYLNALNELRLCAPIALANDVTRALQSSLEFVATKVLGFYRQEQQAFTSAERETFVKLCSCLAYDLIPYMQRCIHAIFPQQTLTNHLGINLLTLEQQQITYLQQQKILEPLKHLLPNKMPDVLLKQGQTKLAEATEAQQSAAAAIAAEG
ncbi:PREDICTED: conserved oligomeric Golgi complex subunit 8 [Rhagoletis zephyria]|uniref:conserved oligomeric Golgi complex subunit 8 n=1 Tax=Rhagoletis zephyria TaxID=28612 RepID=UPI0008114B2A|nr:PREDICTED: conserved oligomeric Golgi complex subunit 8 [Rhagoletis zephyria]